MLLLFDTLILYWTVYGLYWTVYGTGNVRVCQSWFINICLFTTEQEPLSTEVTTWLFNIKNSAIFWLQKIY